jgi:hypothetical protein
MKKPSLQRQPLKTMTADESVKLMRAAGMVVTEATTPFCLPTLHKLTPMKNGQTMSDLVIEMRGPR